MKSKNIIDLKNIVIAAVLFLVIDIAFISMNMDHWYSQVKSVQKSDLKARTGAAVLAYIVMIFAWTYFIYLPHKKYNLSLKESLINGFCLGLSIYGVFEFTNYALLKDWNLYSVVMDTLWGAALYTIITFIMLKYIL